MKRIVSLLLFSFVALVFLAIEACKKKDTSPPATPLAFPLPPGWPPPTYDLTTNPLTTEGFELGRKLFYDGKLSKDGNYPCSSCHQDVAAFGTFDHDLSHGYNNSHTTRNAPGLFNMAWRRSFMYDGAIGHLDQVTIPQLTAINYMAEDVDNVLNKLRADEHYRTMFRKTFGDDQINKDRMTKAISQFLVMMVSSDSRYDKMKRGEYTFNLPESLGYDIFKAKCTSCHQEPFFTDFSFRNIGMAADPTLNDKGRMMVTLNRADSLKFHVPSLRNVQATYPYGHDGRFITLDHVMEHYRSGVVDGPTTDPLVKNRIPLSNFEIGQLKAFLYTLTDSTFLNDQRFKYR